MIWGEPLQLFLGSPSSGELLDTFPTLPPLSGPPVPASKAATAVAEAASDVIARAPQKVTLIAPIVIDAPPARAARAPSIARKARDAIAMTAICRGPGTAQATINGNAAPTMNVPAEENAA